MAHGDVAGVEGRTAAWLVRSLGALMALLVAWASPAAHAQACGGQWLPGDGVPGLNNTVNALTLLPDGMVVAGGAFTTAGGAAANRVARWDGTGWSTLGTGMNGAVNVVASFSSGSLFAGGAFTSASGVAASRVARWNGTSWSALGAGLNGTVNALLALTSTGVVAGGTFTAAGGLPASNIAIWNGASWSPMGSGVNGTVNAVALLSNGDLVVAGAFTAAGLVAANNIAVWDGVRWSGMGSGMNGAVSAVAVTSGGLIAGGSFTTAGGVAANRIARWNGASWSALGSGTNNTVRGLASLSNGDLIAGGDFTTAGGVAANRIARWNGASWSALGTGLNAGVNAVLGVSGNDVIAGGSFATAGGLASAFTARYSASGGPNVADQPASRTLCPGQTLTLTASPINGLSNVTFRWRRNGVTISNGAGGASAGGGTVSGASGALASPTAGSSTTLTITSIAASDAGTYTCVFTNACGNAVTTSATVTVNAAPSITGQPSSLTQCAGASASFAVSASGTSPSFRWRRNGVNISGATSATYTIASVAATDAGSYDCVVSNACGSVTSSAATLTVSGAVVSIAAQPSSVAACERGSATFSVTAGGTAPLTYQWRKGGASISGATSATYTIPWAQSGDAGSYDCVVTNPCGSVTSSVATLTVNLPPSITTQPSLFSVCAGTSATFSVTAGGTGSPAFQWRKDGVTIAGATSATYVIASAAATDAGSYDCVVSNGCGSVTSSAATLSVGEHWLPGDPVAGVERSAMSTTAWDPDGPGPRGPALVVGGAFTVASNIKANSIAMFDLQTMEWSALGSGTNGQVYALAALPDGDLVAGGSFTTAGGVTVNSIARWNGTSWSPLGTGMSGPVEALAILPNGDLLAAGDFTSAGGVVVNGVARWDGASWSDLGGGMNDHVRALAVLASGDVIAGGDFTAAGGVAADHVARWNGVAWSAMGSGMNDTVEALAAHPDGRVVAGGSFFGGIRVWNGTSWSTPGGGTNGRVESLVVLANGDVIAGGLFSDTFSQPGNMIARWNGTSWSSLGGGVDYSVRALTLLSNGDLIAAGRFSLAGGVAASGVARWDGASWSALGTGTNDQISALAFLNGDVIAGGEFVSLAGVSANRIARWNGVAWSAMGTGMNRPVHAVATLPNGDVIAGGAFTEAGGVSANRIARWNGSTWSALGTGMNGAVHALAVLANGDVIAGGAFTEVGGVTMNHIARWNGTSWSALGTGMNSTVYALAVLPNGDLLAGGLFTQAGGIAASRLARWNGASWSPMFTGGDRWSSGHVQALAVLDNGDVIAGGTGGLFVSGRVTSNIARWDGVSWSRMGDGTPGSVYAITQVPNGDVIVGGSFWAASGPDLNYIARWNGVAWSTMGAGMNGWVNALAARPDGGVIAGGGFTTAGGRVSAHFARYSSTGSPAAIALTPSRTFCTGGTATLSASVADGYPNVSFQWRRNGALVADGPNGASPGGGFVTGATGTLASPTASSTVTLTISSVAVADAGAYTCDFTSPCGTARSEKCTVTVNAITPSITSQPSSISRCAGTSASFTVGASGTSSTFQWRKAGVPIPGATLATYAIASVAAVDAGPYDCVVSTPCGSVTSSTATLTVNVGPSITLQPSSRSACAGTSTTFTIVATGVPAPTFQWRKGGAPIVGATASTLTIASVAAADASSYDCVVTDGCASVVSSAATLAVNVVPSITSQPFAAAACLGSSAFFRVTSTGDSRTFQWRLDGVPIPGATASRYDIASMTAADAGSYDCIISNECGSVTSASATLTLRPVPGITTQPTSRSACVNASTTFSIAVSSSSQVQWRKDGVPIDGATSRNFTINPVIAASAGSYDCVVSTTCSSITSAAASLTVNVSPSITVQPTPRTLCVGASTTFTVAATGTPEPTFQWRRGVFSIPGATSASLTIASVAESDAGSYTCVVTNSCGSVTSSSAPLTVNASPLIDASPVSRTVCTGTLVEMQTSTASTLATTFQWRKGGVPIPGATSSTYVIAFAAESDAGAYTCVVTTECGSSVSGSATLRVNPVPGNDGISDAFTLVPGVAMQGDTTCASIDAPDAATCDGQAVTAPGLWYRLAGTGTTVMVSLCGSQFDTRLSAFCGAPGSLTCVAGNDNSCESSSSVTFCTRPGSDYFILVHGVNLAKGRFTILATDMLTACDTAIECPLTGACCIGSGCSQLTVAACESAGGSFLGAGTACETVSYDDRHQSPGPFPAAILDLATVTASIVVPPGSGDVEGLAVRVGIIHSYVGDLNVTLTRGSTTISLIGIAVSSGSDLDGVYTFADSAATTFESASFGGPVVMPGVYRPEGELSVFNGQSFEGTWTLSIRDTANIDVGWLRSFTLATTTTTTTECDACPPCAADYNIDGGIDSGDIESFFTAWEGSEPCADVNADGGIDFGDISDFYAAWELGGC